MMDVLLPLQESVELRPMYGASDASDASAASDSGGASFLGQLWDAVQVGWGSCAGPGARRRSSGSFLCLRAA
jgi:hypothetical protein